LIEEAGALPPGADGEFLRRKLRSDEVAGEKHRIGFQAVDVVNDLTDKERLSEFVHVDIADLRDAEAVKGRGKAGNNHVALGDFDPMPLEFARIERETARSACACLEEAASRDLRFSRGAGHGHIPWYRILMGRSSAGSGSVRNCFERARLQSCRKYWKIHGGFSP